MPYFVCALSLAFCPPRVSAVAVELTRFPEIVPFMLFPRKAPRLQNDHAEDDRACCNKDQR